MSKYEAQFPFKRYGTMMLVVALGLGVYLSRHAAGCIKDGLSGMDLGEISDLERKEKFDPMRRPRGSYARSATEGTTFMERMVGTFPHCVATSTFSDPRWAHTALLILLAGGLLFVVLDKLIAPKWKKEVRTRSGAAAQDVREFGAKPTPKGQERPNVIDVDHLLDPPERSEPRSPRRRPGGSDDPDDD